MDSAATSGNDDGVAGLLSAQTRVLELIAADAPLRDIFDTLARTVEAQAGGTALAAIFLIDPPGGRLRIAAAPSLPADFGRGQDGIDTTPGGARLPSMRGFARVWPMPIKASNGRELGTLATYFREAREPTEHERQVVELLCRTAALAIERRAAGKPRAAAAHAWSSWFRAPTSASGIARCRSTS
jgi:GAF domain-containing protein